MLGTMTINMAVAGRAAWQPDLLALVLVFWGVHQPLRVGLGIAFAFGLAIDVHQGALLGQHAWAYTLLSYLAITIHRRLLWFSLPVQALHLVPLFAASHALALALQALAGGVSVDWLVLAAPLIEAALWPLATALLLAPQRRAPDPDVHRPL
jgi:rod shape-determining protein MreD